MKTKICSRCKQDKQEDAFNKDPRYVRGLSSRCKACDTEVGREHQRTPKGKAKNNAWKKANKDKVKRYAQKSRTPERRKDYHYRRTYGITLERFNELLAAQFGACAVCRTADPGSKGWNLDHDHETANIRGILCRACNIALGMAGENVDRLQKCIDYLRFHKSETSGAVTDWFGFPQGGFPTTTGRIIRALVGKK